MPGSRARSALARIPLGRTLVAVGVVLVVINVASAVWDVRTAYDRVERRAQRDLSNMTRVLAEQTAASLEAVDVMLRDLVRTGPAPTVAEGVSRLRDELAHVSTVATLLVLDAQGRVLARSGETPAIDADPAGHPFFAVHRDAVTSGLHLSEPYREPIEEGQWRFLLSRRLNGPGGRFGGVVAAAIEPVLLSALAVRGFPLLVASGRSERDVLAPWRDEAWQVFDRTLLTSVAMLGLIVFATWGLKRRERALASNWRRYQAMIASGTHPPYPCAGRAR